MKFQRPKAKCVKEEGVMNRDKWCFGPGMLRTERGTLTFS